MSNFKGKRLPPFSDDKQFEIFALDLWGSKHEGAETTLYGRSGQAQYGVDVVVRTGDRLIGIQCKATQQLDDRAMDAEITRAKGFTPALTDLIIVTTAPHDAKLVSHSEAITKDHKKRGLFAVSYHGWDDIQRILEDHQWIVYKHYREFFRSPEEKAALQPPTFRMPVASNLNIMMDDEQLAIFCSEASWSLKEDPTTILAVEQADEQRALAMIAAIEAADTLDADARKERSNLREVLAYYSPKMRRAEVAAKLLLTDDTIRSPWLVGGCWPDTAATMRRLMPQIIKGSERIPGGLSLKIGTRLHPNLVGHIDFDESDRRTFEERCDTYNPHYFVGGIPDLGTDLGLKYALPAGIAALVRYSIGHQVPIESLQHDGTNGIYAWELYPS